MISFEDFKKMELKTATITEVKDHPNADKLYILTIDLGEEVKECVAGIKQFYTKEELVGKQVVVVNNLEPAVIRGVRSNAMILAAMDENLLSIAVMDKKVKNGLDII
jgi:methionyl-tRNA synthetase